MKQQIWTEDYKITSFLVNLRGRLGLFATLNLLQDVGWQHAIHADVRLPKNHVWIFTRQILMMTEWPAWQQSVSIRTWLRPPAADRFLLRDYEIFLKDKKIGEATSTFSLMDVVSRTAVVGDWREYSDLWRTSDLLPHQPKKIPVQEDVDVLSLFKVRHSDLDTNNHVNNTKYSQWVLDSLPLDSLRSGFDLKSYKVNFLAETKSEDLIKIEKARTEIKESDLTTLHFQGLRASDQKHVFSAQLQFSEK